jgi:hypothetical protein
MSSTTKKIAIGLGVAGGALLAAWLLTGDRKKKTKEFVAKRANDLKKVFNSSASTDTDPEDINYV